VAIGGGRGVGGGDSGWLKNRLGDAGKPAEHTHAQ